jgi:hypothetical protein
MQPLLPKYLCACAIVNDFLGRLRGARCWESTQSGTPPSKAFTYYTYFSVSGAQQLCNRNEQEKITTTMKIVSALLLLTVGFAAADDGEFELFPILRFLDVEL